MPHEGPEAPQTLVLTSDGGLGAPRYRVEWTGASLTYELSDDRTGAHDVVELEPSAQDWRRFWNALERAGVWEWASDHSDFAAVDAHTWAVEIAHDDRQVRAGGNNSYPPDPVGPDEAGGEGGSESEPTRSFRTLCSAVRRLTGGRPFE